MTFLRSTTQSLHSDHTSATQLPGENQRWSTWDDVTPLQRGPEPRPDWLITASAAFDTELGALKSGKEAEVHLIQRAVPGTDGCLLAAKRYLSSERSDFHRSSTYTEGRRVKDSREARAMKRKSAFGRQAASGHWANTEFVALCEAWKAGIPVPYPVQIDGTEILMEFIGDGRTAAPRLAQTRRGAGELAEAFEHVRDILLAFARRGYVHGDLSPYNLLDAGDRIVVIDLPQVIDVAANPMALDFLHRDVTNMTTWFQRRGLDVDPDALFAELVAQMW